MSFLLLGKPATATMLMTRFAKLKNDDLDWWIRTVEAMVPKAKEKLAIFEEVVSKLKTSGDLQGIAVLGIESDERWITKRKSILRDSLKTVSQATNQAAVLEAKAKAGNERKRINSPTVEETKNKKARLGMGQPGS